MRTSRLLSSVSVTTKYEFFLSKKVDDPLRFYRDPSIQKTCLKNENTYLVTSAVFEVVRKSIFPVMEFFKRSSISISMSVVFEVPNNSKNVFFLDEEMLN